MFKKLFLLLAVVLPMTAMAQKFAVVDIQTVFAAMPETVQAQNQLQETSKQFQDEFQKLSSELEKLYGEFQQLAQDPNTPDSIKERRMNEIQERQAKAEQFRQSAEQDLARQQEQLMAPIHQRLTEAIKAVGQEGSYTLILPLEESLLLYIGSDVTNVTDQVKRKLGI